MLYEPDPDSWADECGRYDHLMVLSPVGRPGRARLVFSEHALDRMLDWPLDVSAVETAVEGGETIEECEDGSRLLLGRSGVRSLHVVVNAVETDTTVVITVYAPGPAKWDAAFSERKQG